MTLSESDTRGKLIDAALHTCGWTEDLIRPEETAKELRHMQHGMRCCAKPTSSKSDGPDVDGHCG